MEGVRLLAMYKPLKLPCILIVDPLTGAKLYSRYLIVGGEGHRGQPSGSSLYSVYA